MNHTGQGAIEYLLIIGAAVIIAVIVIALMMSLAGTGTENTQEAGLDSAYSGLMGIKDKHKGIMTITLKFIAGVPTDVIVPAATGGTTLAELFPNVPNGTELLYGGTTYIYNDGWGAGALVVLNAGDNFTITAGQDFEQEVEVEQPANNVIMIYDCDSLFRIGEYGDYSLGIEIDCEGSQRLPIGFAENFSFKGEFHGNNMKITNLQIFVADTNPEYTSNQSSLIVSGKPIGLFSRADGATIEGVVLENNVMIYSSKTDYFAGAVVGEAMNDSSVSGEVDATVFGYNLAFGQKPLCGKGC